MAPDETAHPNPHDALFKRVFGDPVHARDELRHVLSDKLAKHIRWDTIQPLPTDLLDSTLRSRHADLLYSFELADERTEGADAKQAFLYVLFEHKSERDPMARFQLLAYAVRVWEAHLREHQNATSLPPILGVIVHHSDRPWDQGTDFAGILDLPDEIRADLEPFLLPSHFVVDDLTGDSSEAIRRRAMSAFAALALFLLRIMRHTDDPLAELLAWVDAFRSVRDQHGAQALRPLMVYIVQTSDVSLERLQRFFEAHVGAEVARIMKTTADMLWEKGVEQGLEKGLEQGVEEGLQKGRAGILLSQLRVRFGDLSEKVVARIRNASADELERWALAVLDADSLEAVFQGRK